MKNENMVRTVHNVSRTVRFDNSEEGRTFITLYDHLFYRAKDKTAWNHDGYKICNKPNKIYVSFTIKKSEFDKIVRNLGLKKVSRTEYVYS